MAEDSTQERSMSGHIIEQLLELHNGALAISSELDLDRLLQQIVETARSLTCSHYAALGVVGDDGLIDLFITSGISEEQREQMGELPRGHGLLGVLIKEGKPIRIPNIGKDPRSIGFPPHHPLMLTLLGMPIRYMGRVVGDLYLTDKDNGELWSDEDEWLVSMLANHAAVAIGNAYLYRELQEHRERAEAARQRLTVILENLPEGVVVCDTDGTITMLNQSAERLIGLSVGGNLHHRPATFRHTDGSLYDDAELPMSRTLASGMLVSAEHMIVGREDLNSEVDVLTSTTPLFDVNGGLRGGIAVYQNITALKTVERLKDEFFSMATHELRTPLTSITVSAGLLAELTSGQGGKVARLARLVDDSAQRMRSLVDDLLDLTRLEHGRLTLYRSDFNLGKILEHASIEISPIAERKGQQLTIELPKGGYQVNADATRIEQVTLNLLANAVKYTPEGGRIRLSVSQDEGETVVAVADNGPGVSVEDHERIFERFYRGSKQDATSTSGGTGLGLPISRLLIELHGGRIWLEDAPGGGSIFSFAIPG